ncbi:MAG: sigma-70 family RNA polymerase sigma factor [Rubrobacter sp.]|nr:sigma-70 family RNA polymerase sigma factor [Rubrobacter sp.]
MELSKVMKLDDAALAARAKSGDRAAFSELVARHEDVVYRVCYRVLGSREDAEDAAQEAFVRAYRKLDSFEGRSSFKTWMVRLSMNVSLNERSKRKGTLPEAPMPAPAPDPERELLSSEAAARVHGALQKIQPNYRAAITLRDLEGLSYKEIGESLDIAEGTARVWAHRGRTKLREVLSQ